MRSKIAPRALPCARAGVLFLVVVSCAQLPPTSSIAVPPIPAGETRLWFYRDDGPYESQERPFVRLNGHVVGISEPTGAFYRDVAPGHYTITVDSYMSDLFNQFASINLAVGQDAYVKVLSMRVKVGGEMGGSRPIFYTYQIPPGTARPEVARTPFYGSS
jgi:hypothetical protein